MRNHTQHHTVRTTTESDEGDIVFELEIDFDLDYRLAVASVVFEVAGLLLALLVLLLSVFHRTSNSNIGLRIFAANVMVMDIINSFVMFLNDLQSASEDFFEWFEAWNPDLRRELQYRCSDISLTTLLVFNCLFVPMMAMSVIAFQSPGFLSRERATFYYVSLIVLADSIPLAFQAICWVFVWHYTPSISPHYAIFSLALYLTQTLLTSIAVRLLCLHHSKSRKHNGGARRSRKELIGILLFAIGPSLIQVPVVLWLVVRQLSLANLGSKYLMYLSYKVGLAQGVVMASKTFVDACFCLIFLSEYRQYTVAFARTCRRLVHKILGLDDPYPSGVASVSMYPTESRRSVTSKPTLSRN